MEKQISYQDIFLKPQKCIVDSRKECDTSVTLGKYTFDMPVYPANMKSVVDIDTCKFLASKGWFYTMHRFGIDAIDFILEMNKNDIFTSISIGINKDSYDTLEKIYQHPLFVDYITIDVANAWSEKTHKMIDFIKNKFPETFLIVGNVATHEAVEELKKWGASAIKAGISSGNACITKNKTGVYRGMITTLLDCCYDTNFPIIADGGIIEHGDIAKAISLGSRMVMAGSLFSAYDQSAGNLIEIEDRIYKEYYGSASKYNKNECKNIEGKKKLIQYKGDMNKLLIELKEDLQSSISYIGGKCLKDLNGAECGII